MDDSQDRELNKKLDGLTEGGPIALSIGELARWRRRDKGSHPRLWLPPIQRSLVWTNEQIVRYWDSLLRGYPAGLMMVHKVDKVQAQGYDVDGNLREAAPDSYQLFDGQQRMAAILLGMDEGPLKNHLRLWVDLGQGARRMRK